MIKLHKIQIVVVNFKVLIRDNVIEETVIIFRNKRTKKNFCGF